MERVEIGLSYRPAGLHRLGKQIPWNRFLGSMKDKKFGLWNFRSIYGGYGTEKEPSCGTGPPAPRHILFKRQAARHDCLPSWLGDRDKGNEIVYGEENEKFYLPERYFMYGTVSC